MPRPFTKLTKLTKLTRTRRAFVFVVVVILVAAPWAVTPDFPITPVAAAPVTLTDAFRAPKLETNRRVTIPHIMREDETTRRVDSFRKGARQMSGSYTGRRGGPQRRPLTFVPSYAWNNRGAGEMAVWIPAAAGSTSAARQTTSPASPKPGSAGSGLSRETSGRSMAITFDDLPKSNGIEDIEGARRTTASMLRVLKAHKAPAVGFVNEGKLYTGAQIVPDRVALLQSWVDAGIPLANHTYSHLDINEVPLAKYQDDLVRGERTYTRLQRGTGITERWFRHPYTHTGPTAEIKAALDRFLAGRGYRVAPFTIENSDWVFSTVYAKAKKAADAALAARTVEAYLAYTETMLGWYETLAKEDFGRDIPQILLIHANELHTDALDALLTTIEQRGYRWVTLADAMKDAAYATPDELVTTYGPSWLHRWRVAKKLPPRTRDEPEPPQWVVDASRQ